MKHLYHFIIRSIVTFIFIECIGLCLGSLAFVLSDYQSITTISIPDLLMTCGAFGLILTAIPTAIYSLISIAICSYSKRNQYVANFILSTIIFIAGLLILGFGQKEMIPLILIEYAIVSAVSIGTTHFQKKILIARIFQSTDKGPSDKTKEQSQLARNHSCAIVRFGKKHFFNAVRIILLCGAIIIVYAQIQSFYTKKKIADTIKSGSSVIDLDEIAKFPWDNVFIFPPYSSREEIKMELGYPLPIDNQSEGHTLLIFTQNSIVTLWVRVPREHGDFASLPRQNNYTYKFKRKQTRFIVNYDERTKHPYLNIINNAKPPPTDKPNDHRNVKLMRNNSI